MRKIVLYIASSLDGYIADSSNTLNWLTVYHGDYGYNAFMKNVDTVLMGRKTYEWVAAAGMANPHPEQMNYVFTSTPDQYTPTENIVFTSNNPVETAAELKSKEGKDIFLAGGGGLIRQFLETNLIDEYILFIVPILLGKGTRLFETFEMPISLETISTEKYDDGMMELRLRKK